MTQHTHVTLARGSRVYFDRPFHASSYTLEDLTTGVGRMCRYGGAIRWSVAQHLLLCERLTRLEAARLPVLIHDLHEAIVIDVPTPMKPWLGTAYAELEARAAADVHRRMGVPWPLAPEVAAEVHRVDRLALRIEVSWFGCDEIVADFGGALEGLETAREYAAVRKVLRTWRSRWDVSGPRLRYRIEGLAREAGYPAWDSAAQPLRTEASLDRAEP